MDTRNMANWGYGGDLPLHNSSMSRFSTGSPEPEPSRSRPSQLPVQPSASPSSHAHSGGIIGASSSTGTIRAPQYNPAALLDPRGGYQEMRQQQRPQHTAFGQTPQGLNFQFDSPSASHAHPTQVQYINSTNRSGMGAMVERMHNVADRSQTQPIKRQKIHDLGRESAGRIGSGFNVLGNYVREQQQIGQKDESKSSVVNLEGLFVISIVYS